MGADKAVYDFRTVVETGLTDVELQSESPRPPIVRCSPSSSL